MVLGPCFTGEKCIHRRAIQTFFRRKEMDCQVLIQCRDSRSTTFFRFEVATLSAGFPLPLGKRPEGTPATHIDLSLLCAFSGGEAQSGLSN